jgi:hypothetical protein
MIPDFLVMFSENCKNFSFDNPQLWRSKEKYNLTISSGQRNDPLAFLKSFFNDIEHNIDEYPVRKNLLIGGTNRDICFSWR